jgi:hypothetical protein
LWKIRNKKQLTPNLLVKDLMCDIEVAKDIAERIKAMMDTAYQSYRNQEMMGATGIAIPFIAFPERE